MKNNQPKGIRHMMDLDQRNVQLEKKLKDTDLPKAIEILIKDAKKRKRQIRFLAFSIALDVLLTVGLGVISVRTHNLAAQADNNRVAILRTCESGNAARANNKQLWTFLLSLPSPNAPTLQEQANRGKFKAFIDMTFAPRDCSKAVE